MIYQEKPTTNFKISYKIQLLHHLIGKLHMHSKASEKLHSFEPKNITLLELHNDKLCGNPTAKQKLMMNILVMC